MRINNDVRDFIIKKVEAKVAKVSIEQDFKAAVALAEQFEEMLSNKLSAVAEKEFKDFLSIHPELANSTLTNPILRQKFRVTYRDSIITEEYQKQLKMRTDYVDELIQRVCIDATSCKDTEELLKLIDKIVGV